VTSVLPLLRSPCGCRQKRRSTENKCHTTAKSTSRVDGSVAEPQRQLVCPAGHTTPSTAKYAPKHMPKLVAGEKREIDKIQLLDKAGHEHASPATRPNQLVYRCVRNLDFSFVLGNGRSTLDFRPGLSSDCGLKATAVFSFCSPDKATMIEVMPSLTSEKPTPCSLLGRQKRGRTARHVM
jgi:hypothetical protein